MRMGVIVGVIVRPGRRMIVNWISHLYPISLTCYKCAMLGQRKREQMATTIGAAAENIGSASRAVAAIVTLSIISLLVAIVALIVSVRGK